MKIWLRIQKAEFKKIRIQRSIRFMSQIEQSKEATSKTARWRWLSIFKRRGTNHCLVIYLRW